MQVGCLEHCYGSTTLDTSGMTLAQVEALLNELQVPNSPTATGGPAAAQHATQQTATQSENGVGDQSQAAGQSTNTTQVVVTTAGEPGDGGTAAAVNQTAQGIVQLQVGCIFYCSGTEQTQQAQQSNATVQSVDAPGAGAVNTVSRVLWQVQVGCLEWCYDAVESQSASGTDASVVGVAAPPVATPPVATGPASPASPVPARTPAASTGARTRDSGGAALRVPVSGLGAGVSGAALVPVAAVVPVAPLAPVAATATVPAEVGPRASHLALRRSRHVVRHHAAQRPAHRVRISVAGPALSAVVARSSAAQPDLELAAALMLAALGIGAGVWRRREVR
ncbi:MAG TPA: hypothetical protein VHV28_05460 [Solirubrobacteraceae bacterium]|nr:hypothetical protein [Solirubrobacteraceae bacterium]